MVANRFKIRLAFCFRKISFTAVSPLLRIFSKVTFRDVRNGAILYE